MRFSEKNVLVTGATSGIGREVAKLFAQRGAAVTVTGRDTARGQAVVDELASSSAPARFIATDILVNNAASGGGYGYVVVGACTAGCVIAARLSEDPSLRALPLAVSA